MEKLRNRQVKNFLTVTMMSLGVPLIPMGEEVRRTQQGNNTAYCQLEFELPLGGTHEVGPWRCWVDTALDWPHDIIEWEKAPSV